MLNQRGKQEEEGGKGKKTRRNTGVEGGDTRQLNTTADEAARPVRSRDGLRSPQCEVRRGSAGDVATAFLGWGPRAGHSLYGLPSLQTLRPQRAGQQESVVRRAAGGVLVPPHGGHGRSGLSSPVGHPPAWDSQPGCWVGAGVQARERERKNTETALVEVQGGHRSYPHPSAPYPSSPTHPSKAKNKNVEKNLCTDSPSRKMGAGMVALPGAHSPQLIYNPSPWLKKTRSAEAALGATAPPRPVALVLRRRTAAPG